jgi:two-component system phosphate regulon sensor histidine kinase PhoR
MTLLVVALVSIAVTAVVTSILMQRRVHVLAKSALDVVRNPSRRVPIASTTGDLRELADWINALAEDAERSRQALHHERTLLASVADALTHGVIAIDGERRIEMMNDAARNMLGVTSSLVGEPLLEFVRVPELHALIDRSEDASAEVQLPNGPRALVRAARTWGRAGRVLLLEDVTNVRKLESVRRDFVANVSHELRTPVAVIRANSETLLAGASKDPVMGPKLTDALHRNAERLARIIADLLDLSRLDAGQYRLDVTPVDVASVAEQSLSAIDKRNATIDVAIAPDLTVRADPKALDQILVNLIDNAVRYSGQGHVWVEARDDDDAIRIEVRDDGPGIADKHRERVFERFYRADPSRAREAGGTGLGLSIVKHLVESMNGAVGVEPNTPQGSIFWLRLPKATNTAAA